MVTKIINRLCQGCRNVASSSASRLVITLATLLDYFAFILRLRQERARVFTTSDITAILEKLNEEGIVIIEEFLTAEICNRLRKEVGRIIADYPQYIHPAPKADIRIFGAQNLSKEIAS